MSFGENIKRQRLALGMTLEEVANKVGVTRQTMSRYETGVIKSYSPETILKIAEVLQTTGSFLLGYEAENIGLGERLKNLRIKRGLTLDEVARKIGVSNATVSRWETGEIKAIGSDKIGALADVLGTTTEYLLGRSNNVDTEADEDTAESEAETDDTTVTSKFAKNLRTLRFNKGWKQEDVANMLGLSQQTISTYEDGTCPPSLDVLIKIAELFNVSTDYLLGVDNKSYVSKMELSLKSCPFLGGESLDEQTSNKLLEKRGTLIGELKILRKAIDEINKTLDSLGVRE